MRKTKQTRTVLCYVDGKTQEKIGKWYLFFLHVL